MKSLVKHTLIVALATLAASASFAASLVKPVASVRVGGGMPGPDGVRTAELTLNSDGSVVQVETLSRYNSSAPQVTRTLIASIHGAKMKQNLSKAIGAIKGGQLSDSDPSMPQCMDAPSTTYSIYKGGQRIDVYSVRGCKPFELAGDQRYSAEGVKNYLDALTRLTY